VDGILNVNKPAGWTSFDVVAFVRRHSGVKRVGHAGTLDPSAEGVLVVCLGQATRILEYLLDAGKSYRARIRLGVTTDTYDADGAVVRTADASAVTCEAVEQALDAFRGRIRQRPPMFSAIKRQGTALYRHARAGREVELEERDVEVYRLDLVQFEPPVLTLEVDCGRGFYVRSLANDLGARLGCGAHLEGLLRTAVGPFRIESTIEIEKLRAAFIDGTWPEFVLPADSVLLDWHAAILAEESVENVCFGRALDLTPVDEPRMRTLAAGTLCRAYSLDGRLVALLRYGGDSVWEPSKVLFGAQKASFE
jgi:tRNA pseudouridine55 synthase